MSQHAFAISLAVDRVDRSAGVIHGVSVITEGVANGVVVDALTLRQIKECSEGYANGLKVVDRHTRGTDSVFATVGVLRNFRIEGPKLLADLFTLKSEPNTEKLMEMAATIPDTFGLSVAFGGPNENRDGVAYARCAEIYNAALVDVPAANPTGLFSKNRDAAEVCMVQPAAPAVDATDNGKAKNAAFSKNMSDQPDLEARLAKIEAAVAEMAKKFSCAPEAPEAEMSKLRAELTELSAKLDTSTKELAAKVADRESLAQVFAKEFSRHVGASPAVAAAPAASTNAGAGLVEQFVELAKKHFADTKSKVKATQLAIKEAPEAYKAFAASGADIKWA